MLGQGTKDIELGLSLVPANRACKLLLVQILSSCAWADGNGAYH